jgi:hypothetical protein
LFVLSPIFQHPSKETNQNQFQQVIHASSIFCFNFFFSILFNKPRKETIKPNISFHSLSLNFPRNQTISLPWQPKHRSSTRNPKWVPLQRPCLSNFHMHNTSSKPQKEEIPTSQTIHTKTNNTTPRRKIRITKEIDLVVAQPQRERERERERGMGCRK